MKRQPTLLEALSTIIVMVIIVIVGFVGFEIPIQALLILSSAYAVFIRRDYEATSYGDASDLHHSICRDYRR